MKKFWTNIIQILIEPYMKYKTQKTNIQKIAVKGESFFSLDRYIFLGYNFLCCN